jgi:RHS repeat-associated protein
MKQRMKESHEKGVANRLNCLTVCAASYDAAGNMLTDGNGAITYDAENRISKAGGVTYTYDGDGNRVMKSNGTIYWTGANGEVLAESNLSGTMSAEYMFLNGSRIVRMDRPSGTNHFYFSDTVGSTTMITDAIGTIEKESDYTPYGIEIPVTGSDPNHYKFTGKERDTESGLDSFGKRFYASTMGRWMSPDLVNITEDRVVNPANTLGEYTQQVRLWREQSTEIH